METILKITDVSEYKEKFEHVNIWSDNWEGFIIQTTKQEIKILISNSSSCCERWGHFSTNDNLDDFIGAAITGIKLTDTALNTKKVELEIPYGCDGGEIQFVDIITNQGNLQFAVYNKHNGYYGHPIMIQSEQLIHVSRL